MSAEASGETGTASTPFGEVALALLFVTVAGAFAGLAFGFTAEARRVPLVVGVPTFALTLLNLGRVLARHRVPRPRPAGPPGEAGAPASAAAGSNVSALGWLAAYCALFVLIGSTGALFVFGMLLLRVRAGERLGKVVVSSAAITVGFHVLMVAVLGFPSFPGVLPGVLR